ncbi:MAG TPA: acyltransferase [Xanthobacteraceae bacterium]|nr:acyltransferase [Xanthobacteraceae bacterium]
MSSPAPARPGTIVTIQYLRGIAASLVALYHAAGTPPLGPAPSWLADLGVDLFFVISGCIMWATTERGRKPLAFWEARLLRIVPLYWIFTTAYVAVGLLWPAALFNAAFDPLFVVKSYLFVPAVHPTLGATAPVYTLGWTLNYEMFFYLVFGLCLFIPWRLPRLAVVIATLVALVLIGAIAAPDGAVAAFYTRPIMLDFAAGILLASLAPRLYVMPPAAGLALIAFALLWLAGAATLTSWTARLALIGIPAVATVAGALILEPLAQRRVSRLALLLGDASYALYLAHPFAQRAWYLIYSAVIGRASEAALAGLAVTMFAAGLCGGILCHLLIERPILAARRYLRG